MGLDLIINRRVQKECAPEPTNSGARSDGRSSGVGGEISTPVLVLANQIAPVNLFHWRQADRENDRARLSCWGVSHVAAPPVVADRGRDVLIQHLRP